MPDVRFNSTAFEAHAACATRADAVVPDLVEPKRLRAGSVCDARHVTALIQQDAMPRTRGNSLVLFLRVCPRVSGAVVGNSAPCCGTRRLADWGVADAMPTDTKVTLVTPRCKTLAIYAGVIEARR
jgi:hypothetical protein